MERTEGLTKTKPTKFKPSKIVYLPDTPIGRITSTAKRIKQTSDFYLKGGEKPEPKPTLPPKEKKFSKEIYYTTETVAGKIQHVARKTREAKDFYLKGANPLMPTASESKK